MRIRLLAGILGAGLLLTPWSMAEDSRSKSKPQKMDEDMRRAIAFERLKDRAAARQERQEARHPSVKYSDADRSADQEDEQGRAVKDPGAKRLK